MGYDTTGVNDLPKNNQNNEDISLEEKFEEIEESNYDLNYYKDYNNKYFEE